MLLLIWRFQTDRIRYINLINQVEFKYEQLLEESEIIKHYFFYQNQILPKSLIVDLIKKNSNISKRKKENYLIACFSKENCGICMKRLIVDLDDFKKKNNFTQIFLLGDIPENEFYSMLEINKLDNFYIFIPELFINNKNYFKYPLLFVINSKGDIQHLFIPDLLKDFNEIYFNKVLPNLILNKFNP